jgi:TonB-linked SusC/RagA family outer membrane protein
MMKKIILLFFLVLTFAAANGQVRGKILDGGNNEPLLGATVQVKGTLRGTMVDVNGAFMIDASVGDVLEFSFVGYKSVEHVVTGPEEITITLFPDETVLDEVVVVGYGVQKRSDVTGSVASVSSRMLESRPEPNIIQSLQGAVAGLSISQTGSNAEGSNTITRIRGSKSITASNFPLVILDGIPFSGSWAEINPNDIESIEILKDASSAAIYGARGANGVILIQTKRARAGEKIVVSYDASLTTYKAINIPKMMDGPTFYERKAEAGLSFSFTEQESFDNGEWTDWVDIALRRGLNHLHNLSIRGSGEKSRYYISGSFADNRGIAVNDQFRRTTLRINFEHDAGKYFTIGTSTQFGYYDRSGKEADFSEAYQLNPLGQAYTETGELRLQTWEDNNYAKNPLSSLNEIDNDYKNSLITNNYLLVRLPIDGLSYKLNTGYTFDTYTVQNYQGRNTYEGALANGILNISNRFDIEWIVENILSYNKNFGKHTLFLTALYSAQMNRIERNSIEASDFPNDVMTFYQPDKGGLLQASASQSRSGHLSQMGRVNYSYDSRYLFTATMRRDGYSAFGDDRKYGLFPSVAVGWNIMNESFFRDAGLDEKINNLKLRLSWGKNGNEAISPYASLPVLRSIDYLTDNYAPAFGFYPSQLGSPLLGWETTTSINAGVDYGFLKNRIRGSLEYYRSNTFDLLLSKTIPSINGTSTIIENIGSTESTGIEFQISSVNMSKSIFGWATDFNIVRDNTVLADVGLYGEDGVPIDDIASLWFIGYPVSVNYDYEFDGIYQEGEVPPDAPFNSQPGFIRYKDQDEDGNITPEEDLVIIGSREPAFTAGMNNRFTFGNFTLSVFLNAKVGETRSNWLLGVHTLSFRRNQYDKEFWSPDNPINTYPANIPDGQVNPARMSFYQRTDFLRVQDINLNYRVPQDVVGRVGLQNLEVYANVKNLLTFTNWVGLDPEFVTSGVRQRAIPQTRQFLFGFRTRF